MTEPRRWPMYAGDRGHGIWSTVGGHPRFVKMHGHETVHEVTATEDPDGPYWGWIGAEYLHYQADREPRMIQPRQSLFAMQFPYGPDAEVAHGHGEIVRLSITPDPSPREIPDLGLRPPPPTSTL